MFVEDWYLKQTEKLQGEINKRRAQRDRVLAVLADIGVIFNDDGTFTRTEGTKLEKDEIERLRVYIDMTLKEEGFLSDRMLGKSTIKVASHDIDGIVLDDAPEPNGE